MLSPA
jgi:hypothetical protein